MNVSQDCYISSLTLAKKFEKLHRNILRDIREVCLVRDLEYVEIKRGKRTYQILVSDEIAECLGKKYAKIGFERKAKERIALTTIEQVLGITLHRQYQVDVAGVRFFIDGYHKETKTAYEIDEGHHQNANNKAKDQVRQQLITDKLGCKFVRIKV